jgi:acyl-CoA synthetase (AMP-forming)/AMP-acid ligase II
MTENLIASAPDAYAYPLLVKQVLTNSLNLYGDQEITYLGELRYTYDSHRYLESYFVIPMMCATLFTVNVRLAPHQIAYTLNDSEAEIVLVHTDFVPMLEDVEGELPSVRKVVVLADGQTAPPTPAAGRGRVRDAGGSGLARLGIRRLRREHQGRHLLHHRHHRRPGALRRLPGRRRRDDAASTATRRASRSGPSGRSPPLTAH